MDQNLGLALYQAPVQGGHFQQVSALLKEYNIIANSSGCFGQTQNCREREMKAKAKAKVEGGQKNIRVAELCNSVNSQVEKKEMEETARQQSKEI